MLEIVRNIQEEAYHKFVKFNSCTYSKTIFMKSMPANDSDFNFSPFYDIWEMDPEKIGDIFWSQGNVKVFVALHYF